MTKGSFDGGGHFARSRRAATRQAAIGPPQRMKTPFGNVPQPAVHPGSLCEIHIPLFESYPITTCDPVGQRVRWWVGGV